MRVELLRFDGCPSADAVLPRLRELVAEAGGDPDAIVVTAVETAEAAERHCFLGSPTIRVDGEDVDSGAVARDDFRLTCRLYRTPDGASGMPLDAWVRAALAGAQSRSQR